MVQQQPGGATQGTGQVRNAGVHRDDEIDLRAPGGGSVKARQGARVVEQTREGGQRLGVGRAHLGLQHDTLES